MGQSDIENHESWLPNEINAGWDYLNNSDRKKYLELALEKLEPEESVIIFNYYHEEMSIKELSDITGLSDSNIKIKLFRARKKLYKELQFMLKDEVESLIR